MNKLGTITAAFCLGSAVSAQGAPNYAALAERLHNEVLTKNVCYVTGRVGDTLIELGDIQVSRSDYSHTGYEGTPWVEDALDIDIFGKFEAFGIDVPTEQVSFVDGKDTPNPEKETIPAVANGIPDVMQILDPVADDSDTVSLGGGVLEIYQDTNSSRIYRLPGGIPDIEDSEISREVKMLVGAFNQVLELSGGTCRTGVELLD